MTSKNRYIKGIEQTILRIEEHIVKLDAARKKGDDNLAIYYQKEIYYKFWKNIEKDIPKATPLPKELIEKIDTLTQKLYENQSIPMNSTLSGSRASRGE